MIDVVNLIRKDIMGRSVSHVWFGDECWVNGPWDNASAGLGTTDSSRRDFRRFEGGGLLTNPGDERACAKKCVEIFDEGCSRDDYVIVPKRRLREFALLEARLRDERIALGERCRGMTSLATPSVAGTLALVATCNETKRRCAVALESLAKERRRLPPVAGRQERAKAREIRRAVMAVKTGQWGAWRRMQIERALRSERAQMRQEDARRRIVATWTWANEQSSDYQKYAALVAQYGVPFDEATFTSLARPGAHFKSLCETGASAFQWMWRSRAPAYKARRLRACRRIQTVGRGYVARRKWTPVLRVRAICSVARPRKRAFVHWKLSVARTQRARALLRRVKYGHGILVMREWRRLVGSSTTEGATDQAMAQVIDKLVSDYVGRVVDEELTTVTDELCDAAVGRVIIDVFDEISASLANEPWMDATWFLRATPSYATHVAVAPDVFALERQRARERRAATRMQRRWRGAAGRNRVRRRLASVFRKKFDDEAGSYYYMNVATRRAQWHRPLLLQKLFPHSTY